MPLFAIFLKAGQKRWSSMDILLLGGSNAGLHYGWAAQLAARLPEHRVSNRFLGAVGSLYGLMRLMRLGEDAAPPQLVIFEYALNDAVLLDAGWLRMDLLEDTLRAVAELCREQRLPLLLLCLQPRPGEAARVDAAARRALACYRRLSQRHRLYPCVTQQEALGGVRAEDYVDKLHLHAEASMRVAEHLAAVLRDARVPVPRAGETAPPSFRFVPARAARTQGPCRRVEIVSTVYSDEFLEVSRGGSSLWPGSGRLVALMLRTTETAGAYRLAAGGWSLRKTAQSHIRAVLPKVMLLHYVRAQPAAEEDLEISMPAEEVALMRLPEDRTFHGAPSEAPFAAQKLEIAGVIFWSGAPWPRRLLAAIQTRLDARAPWLVLWRRKFSSAPIPPAAR
ncbi:hypothetical protein B1812_08440 [Methylocystis bryophila]|uniref:SGNH hydrolase-type esterase domain-containing protein n=3 Tax=Methylocystis bryophila TaxID=655015 RepID=A0A1W6MU22_9HYPH|nr:hypothetical protein B1812_08440 [Methylocystis bryophila]